MKTKVIQDFYENTYQYSLSNQDGFEAYERNLALKKIYKNQSSGKLLDLGAGDGTLCKYFLSLGYEVYAIEWTDSGVKKLNHLNVKAKCWDIEKLPYSYEDDFFDEIFWGDNIEHLFFPERVAKEILRILKPGGRLVLSTPNHGWIINRLYYLFIGVPRRTEGHKSMIWEWQHIRYFNKREIFRFISCCGFSKTLIIHATERRQPFRFLSNFFPSLFGSVLIVEAFK